jgi:hypothetical protein
MASKKFAYYSKGNKIALLQKNNNEAYCSLSGYENKTDCENAGGTWYDAGSFAGDSSTYGKYKSPNSTVEKGLEIEYTYAPVYNNFAQPTININKFFINGWTVIGGYLTFLRSEQALDVTNWTSSPYSAVTSGTAGGDNDYILVKDSARWNGIHKVQTAGTEGQLITYTRVNETLPYFEDKDIDFNTDEEIFDGGGSQVRLANHFNAGDYIWTSGVDETNAKAVNNGMFRITSITQSATYADSKIVVDKRYMTAKPAASSTGLTDEIIGDAGFLASSSDSTINIYKAYRDYCHILTDITVMQDETFDLDLTRYQANAVILYMRAKLAEEMGNIELFEYYNVKFTKQLEKASGSRKYGPHIVQGHGMTRK